MRPLWDLVLYSVVFALVLVFRLLFDLALVSVEAILHAIEFVRQHLQTVLETKLMNPKESLAAVPEEPEEPDEIQNQPMGGKTGSFRLRERKQASQAGSPQLQYREVVQQINATGVAEEVAVSDSSLGDGDEQIEGTVPVKLIRTPDQALRQLDQQEQLPEPSSNTTHKSWIEDQNIAGAPQALAPAQNQENFNKMELGPYATREEPTQEIIKATTSESSPPQAPAISEPSPPHAAATFESSPPQVERALLAVPDVNVSLPTGRHNEPADATVGSNIVPERVEEAEVKNKGTGVQAPGEATVSTPTSNKVGDAVASEQEGDNGDGSTEPPGEVGTLTDQGGRRCGSVESLSRLPERTYTERRATPGLTSRTLMDPKRVCAELVRQAGHQRGTHCVKIDSQPNPTSRGFKTVPLLLLSDNQGAYFIDWGSKSKEIMLLQPGSMEVQKGVHSIPKWNKLKSKLMEHLHSEGSVEQLEQQALTIKSRKRMLHLVFLSSEDFTRWSVALDWIVVPPITDA